MRFHVLTALAAVVFLASLVLFDLKLLALLDIGTCASGNQPFEVANPCPNGTGTEVLLLVVSIFGLLLSGAVFLARGRPPACGDRFPGASCTGPRAIARSSPGPR